MMVGGNYIRYDLSEKMAISLILGVKSCALITPKFLCLRVLETVMKILLELQEFFDG